MLKQTTRYEKTFSLINFIWNTYTNCLFVIADRFLSLRVYKFLRNYCVCLIDMPCCVATTKHAQIPRSFAAGSKQVNN